MKAFILYLWRVFRWWLKCLWAGKVIPRKEEKPFSRSYMRKAWRDRLRDLDRSVNLWNREYQHGKRLIPARSTMMLLDRKMMVMKRRAYRFE